MIFRLVHAEARQRAAQAVQSAPAGWIVRITEPTRNLEQNAAMWAMLADVSEQVVWYGQKLPAEDWKAIFTASLKRSKVVPGIDAGTFVVCGQSTSKMTKADFSDLLEVIQAFGAEHNVTFKDEA
jgi:hypothetical protein